VESCWKFIRFFAEEEAARINTVKFVELGMANLVNPVYLEKFGFKDLADQVDQGYVRANKELFSSGHPEPYGKNCQQVYSVLDGVLDKARLEPGTPAKEILAFAEQEMNNKLIGYKPPEEMRRLRIWASGILVGFLAVLLPFVGWLIWRGLRNRSVAIEHLAAGSVRTRVYTFIAICLAPAVISLAVWSYYPIGRGLMIAFQDYRITKPARWVGLDNFIQVFTSPIFYKALLNSFVYVGLTIVIGFLLPILLALALNEIPRFKVFFRTIFYLPAMTSPIVIAILWRQMYDKSEQGLLNTLVAPLMDHLLNPVLSWVHMGPLPRTYDWLGDPKLAMLAVVLPGIWAVAGS
jgi:multiple sugar transport system permease protein